MDEEARWIHVQLLAHVFADLDQVGAALAALARFRFMAMLDGSPSTGDVYKRNSLRPHSRHRAGAGADRRCQSTPATSHCHCSALICQLASPACGQTNWPRCRRPAQAHPEAGAVPAHQLQAGTAAIGKHIGRVRIPPKLDTRSAASWTLIPAQTGHLFQTKLDTWGLRRGALWTRRSRMASARVASPMAACQCSMGSWLVTMVERAVVQHLQQVAPVYVVEHGQSPVVDHERVDLAKCLSSLL
jgi:hypothetical protein